MAVEKVLAAEGEAREMAGAGSAGVDTGGGRSAATKAEILAAPPVTDAATREDVAAAAHATPDGTDAASRASRRAWRERLNGNASRKLLIGTLSTLAGGAFWGFSGTSASFLFDNYHVDTAWLMAVRQLFAGSLFMLVILAFDRKRFVKLWATPADRRTLLLMAAFGLLFNQFFYLMAVRLTNAGTATVMQILELLLIMAYTCIKTHRAPKRRELAGVAMALVGTFLMATGGDPSTLNIPPAGLAVGLLCAVGAACMTIIPVRILPEYGSIIVTGSAMFTSGVCSTLVVQPWAHMPALDAAGWEALAVLVVVGSFLAYFLYMQGVKDVGSMRAGLLATIEPISATVTSAVMLGTVFLPTDIAGFALIIGMVFLTV